MHRDERGTISIVTVFAIMMFTMLLVMVTNVARHADDKIRMQNAADAAAQTGSVAVARGMNSIAFTNHLLSEVFALTAYMREAQAADQGTAALVPEILEEWRRTGQAFEQAGRSAGYAKFEALGVAIQQKVPLEQDVVNAYVEMSAEHSRMTLPVLEYILAGPNWNGTSGAGASPPDPEGGFIPRFQRAVVRNTPLVAHLAADEIVQRHGRRAELQHGGRPLEGRLWRTDVQTLGQGQIDETAPLTRTLPVVDPSPFGPDDPFPQMPHAVNNQTTNFDLALQQRRQLARYYLEQWILIWMGRHDRNNPGGYFDFDDDDIAEGMVTAKMSNLINLWRSATCEHLDQLLNVEYPLTNLPHVIRNRLDSDVNGQLERDYQFVAVVYWPHQTEMFPGLFRNPLTRDGSDAVTFAQSSVLVPQTRLLKVNGSWIYWVLSNGVWVPVPYTDNWETGWNMVNQNWTAKLVPARSESIVYILQANPGGSLAGFRPPSLAGVPAEAIRDVNMH